MINACKHNGEENQIYDAQNKTHIPINADYVDEIIGIISFGEKTVLTGGHYYISNPLSPANPGSNAAKTWKTACALCSKFRKEGFDSYLNLILNDLELSVQCSMQEARKQIRDNFEFPKIFYKIMEQYDLNASCLYNPLQTRSGKGNILTERAICNNLEEGALSENNFVNRFHDKDKRSFHKTFPEITESVYDTDLSNGVTQACAKAITQYLFDLHLTRVDTIILVLPGCCRKNVEIGINAAKKAIPDLKIYAVYQTTNCYE